jgi:hypothetical protein
MDRGANQLNFMVNFRVVWESLKTGVNDVLQFLSSSGRTIKSSFSSSFADVGKIQDQFEKNPYLISPLGASKNIKKKVDDLKRMSDDLYKTLIDNTRNFRDEAESLINSTPGIKDFFARFSEGAKMAAKDLADVAGKMAGMTMKAGAALGIGAIEAIREEANELERLSIMRDKDNKSLVEHRKLVSEEGIAMSEVNAKTGASHDSLLAYMDELTKAKLPFDEYSKSLMEYAGHLNRFMNVDTREIAKWQGRFRVTFGAAAKESTDAVRVLASNLDALQRENLSSMNDLISDVNSFDQEIQAFNSQRIKDLHGDREQALKETVEYASRLAGIAEVMKKNLLPPDVGPRISQMFREMDAEKLYKTFSLTLQKARDAGHAVPESLEKSAAAIKKGDITGFLINLTRGLAELKKTGSFDYMTKTIAEFTKGLGFGIRELGIFANKEEDIVKGLTKTEEIIENTSGNVEELNRRIKMFDETSTRSMERLIGLFTHGFRVFGYVLKDIAFDPLADSLSHLIEVILGPGDEPYKRISEFSKALGGLYKVTMPFMALGAVTIGKTLIGRMIELLLGPEVGKAAKAAMTLTGSMKGLFSLSGGLVLTALVMAIEDIRKNADKIPEAISGITQNMKDLKVILDKTWEGTPVKKYWDGIVQFIDLVQEKLKNLHIPSLSRMVKQHISNSIRTQLNIENAAKPEGQRGVPLPMVQEKEEDGGLSELALGAIGGKYLYNKFRKAAGYFRGSKTTATGAATEAAATAGPSTPPTTGTGRGYFAAWRDSMEAEAASTAAVRPQSSWWNIASGRKAKDAVAALGENNKVIGGLSKLLGRLAIAGVGMETFSRRQKENPDESFATSAVAAGGRMAGTYQGAATGAAIGMGAGPVTAIIGGLIGGIVGGIGGEELVVGIKKGLENGHLASEVAKALFITIPPKIIEGLVEVGKSIKNVLEVGIKDLFDAMTPSVTGFVDWVQKKISNFASGSTEDAVESSKKAVQSVYEESRRLAEEASAAMGPRSTEPNQGSMVQQSGSWAGFNSPFPPQDQVSVEEHAQGGMVRKPTLSWVGEAGPEAIIPTSKFPELAEDVSDSVINKLISLLNQNSQLKQNSDSTQDYITKDRDTEKIRVDNSDIIFTLQEMSREIVSATDRVNDTLSNFGSSNPLIDGLITGRF